MSSRAGFKYDSTKNAWILRGKGGNVLQEFGDDGRGNQVTFLANAFNTKGWGSDAKWIPVRQGVYLEEYYDDIKCWLPFNFLKIGDEIVSYKLVGDLRGGGSEVGCQLYRVPKSSTVTPVAVTGGAIATASSAGELDAEAVLTAVETVVTDYSYLLEIIGSNSGWTDWVYLMGAEVKVNRKL